MKGFFNIAGDIFIVAIAGVMLFVASRYFFLDNADLSFNSWKYIASIIATAIFSILFIGLIYFFVKKYIFKIRK